MTFQYESHAERRKNIIIYFPYNIYVPRATDMLLLIRFGLRVTLPMNVSTWTLKYSLCVGFVSQEKRRGKMLTLVGVWRYLSNGKSARWDSNGYTMGKVIFQEYIPITTARLPSILCKIIYVQLHIYFLERLTLQDTPGCFIISTECFLWSAIVNL